MTGGPTYHVNPSVATPRPVQMTRLADGHLEFSCTRGACRFHRTFGTLAGAKRGISQHTLDDHGVRLVWKDEA